MATTATNCDICTEKYNKTAHSPIACDKCNFVCCATCFITYITDPNSFFKCMSCREEFSRHELNKRMSSSFMTKEYRDCQKIIVYEREKQFFPETQEMIHIRRLQQDAKELRKDMREQELTKDEKKKKRGELGDLKLKIADLKTSTESPERKQRTYILPCAHGDCKGTLLSEEKNENGNYVCVICTGITCAKCRMDIQSDEHECDPDILKSVAAMSRSSKPCPRCGAMIHKISGCDQMFCTQCKCVFSWATLKVQNGVMHNPHYLEWRRQARENGEPEIIVPAGDELNFNHALLIERRVKSLDQEHQAMINITIENVWTAEIQLLAMSRALAELVRLAVHHERAEARAEDEQREGYSVQTNRDMRLKFLQKQITEEYFKKMIQQRNKKILYETEKRQIMRTYADSMSEIVLSYTSKPDATPNDLVETVQAMFRLEQYVDSCLMDAAVAYKYTIPRLRYH